MTQTIAVIRGDGIGPEIMDATLQVLDALKPGWPPTRSRASCCRRRRWTRSTATASR